MKITKAKLDDLHADPANTRQHDKRNLQAIMGSLREFGQVEPLVVQRGTGRVIGGNGRLQALRDMGEQTVEVVEVDVDGVRAASLSIALNRTAELATWDELGLAQILAELQKDDSIDELVTGFDAKDIDQLIADACGVSEIVEDEVPDPPDDPVTKPGDLWLLGKHRVLCGDATKDLPTYADAVLTDPPYGIGYAYESHDDSRAKWFGLIDAVLPNMLNLAPITVMPCCGIDRIGWWYANHHPDWMIAWYKGSPGHRSHVGFNDWEAHLVWGKPPKQMHDYFQTKCGFDVDGHPCPKPVAWGAWLCERVCVLGGTICDPFLGSGTTLIAAEQLGRKCYGLEIEPKYVDVICKRWAKLTGKTPMLEDGAPFPLEVDDG